jgi:hypothetical protein
MSTIEELTTSAWKEIKPRNLHDPTLLLEQVDGEWFANFTDLNSNGRVDVTPCGQSGTINGALEALIGELLKSRKGDS